MPDNPIAPEDPEKQEKSDIAYLQDVCDILRQNFDAVQVFVTRLNPDGTTTQANWGEGNFYARYGQVKQWSLFQDRGMETNMGHE